MCARIVSLHLNLLHLRFVVSVFNTFRIHNVWLFIRFVFIVFRILRCSRAAYYRKGNS